MKLLFLFLSFFYLSSIFSIIKAQATKSQFEPVKKTEKNSEIQKKSPLNNPFLDLKKVEIDQVADFTFFRQNKSTRAIWGGYITHPKVLEARFRLFSQTEEIRDVQESRLSFYLIEKNIPTKQRKEITVVHRTRWQNNRFQTKLYLPRLKKSGSYELGFRVENFQSSKNFELKKTINFSERKVNVIFLIDNSRSMAENDPSKQRFKAIDNIVKSPKLRNKIGRVGVVEFSDNAKLISPMVQVGKLNVKNLEKKIKLGGLTDYGLAFRQVKKLYEESGTSGKTVVIFLTDGKTSFDYKNEHRAVYELGVPIFTIGLHRGRNRFDTTLLKKIADESGGSFSETQNGAMSSVYQKIVEESVKIPESILTYPLKPTYLKNEVVVVRYADLNSNQGEVVVTLGKSANKSISRNGEIIENRKNENGGEVLYFHFDSNNSTVDNTDDNSEKITEDNKPMVFKLNFYRLKSGGRRTLVKQEILKFDLSDEPPTIKTANLLFENIPVSQYEVRYFEIMTSQEQIDFVNLAYYPNRNLNAKINAQLEFPETPFTLFRKKPYKQAIIFNVLPNSANWSDYYEGYLVIESAYGYFLNNFTYTLETKKFNQQKLIRNTAELVNKNRLIYLMVGVSILFFINLLYFLKKRNQNRNHKIDKI